MELVQKIQEIQRCANTFESEFLSYIFLVLLSLASCVLPLLLENLSNRRVGVISKKDLSYSKYEE